MNKEEAYKAMEKGYRITNNLFSYNEFLYIQLGKMYSEEGYRFEDGWNTRNDKYWQEGWSIYE